MWRERAAVEATAWFLERAEGRAMDAARLVCLLYLAEREKIRTRGSAFLSDEVWATPWGPVLANTLDAIRTGSSKEWSEYVRTEDGDRCVLMATPERARLSRAIVAAMEATWTEYGHETTTALMARTRSLPELSGHPGTVPVTLAEIARGVGHDEAKIAQAVEFAEEMDAAHGMMEMIRGFAPSPDATEREVALQR